MDRRLICAGVWWKNSKEKDYLEELVVDGVLKLKYILKDWDMD